MNFPGQDLGRDFSGENKVTVCSHVYNMGLDARKPVFGGFVNNTGADQPEHPRCLIRAFVIRFLESIICKLATGEFNFSS